MINIKDVQKFIEFARGTGKTFTVREQAIKEYKNGKRCAIAEKVMDKMRKGELITKPQ